MAVGNYPAGLLYHAEHGWALVEGDHATLGISWFAQDALGEVMFYDPPEVGAEIVAGESYGEVESLKAVSALIAPLSGQVLEVNQPLATDAELINAEPYGAGWLVKVRLSDAADRGQLLSADAYEASLS